MVTVVVEIVISGIWMAAIGIHTRRLLRLAHVEQRLSSSHDHQLRMRLNRCWWWLGREEFWRDVERDGMRCIQMTIMVFLFAWSLL